MATLGEAFIEVHADTKPFAKELGKQLRTILKAAEPQVRRDAEGLGKALGEGATARVKTEGAKVGKTFSENVEKGWTARSKNLLDKFAEPFERLSRGNFVPTRVLGGFVAGLARGASGLVRALKPVADVVIGIVRVFRDAGAVGVEAFKGMIGVASDVRGAVGALANTFESLGTAIVSMVASAAASIPQLIAMAAAFFLLAGAASSVLAVLLLVGAVLADLLGFFVLLPAALSVILAIILPLVVGFHQLGDAMQLVFEKDPDKLAKGLAKLSAPMRELVESLRSVAPILKQIENATQTALITPILEVLAPTLRDLGPLLAKGFAQVASVSGIFIRDLLTLLDSPVFKQLLTDLFPATARIITALSGPALRLIEAFAAAADKMLPDIERLAGKFGDLIVTFADWIMTSVEDGSFQQFLDDAEASLTSIWNLVQSLITVFGDMFKQVNGDGRDFLDTITRAVDTFDKWVNSPDGAQALQGAADTAKAFGAALLGAGYVVVWIFSVIGDIDHKLRSIIALINELQGKTTAVGGKLNQYGGGFKSLPQFAEGGFPDTGPAMLHQNEVVIPLTKPARAQELMAQSGLWNMGASGQPINVYVGGTKLDEIVDYRVQRGNRANATALASGPRR